MSCSLLWPQHSECLSNKYELNEWPPVTRLPGLRASHSIGAQVGSRRGLGLQPPPVHRSCSVPLLGCVPSTALALAQAGRQALGK